MLLAAVDQYVPPAVVDIPYVTKGVHFNGATYLRRSSGLSGQGTVTSFTWSVWIKLSVANSGIFTDLSGYISQSKAGVSNPYFRMFADTVFDYFDSAPEAEMQSAGWQGITCSANINGANIASIYRGDTDILGDATNFDGYDTIPPTTNFYFGTDSLGNFITGDVADFRLWMGAFIDLTSINNRRLFVRANGKPADPSLANAVLGTPIISFIGTVASPVSTFPVNGGSGGSFTTTGTLTAASTSPTD